VAQSDETGRVVKWVGIAVTRFEAVLRKRKSEAIVRREHEAGRQFCFSVAPGESSSYFNEQQVVDELYRVLSISSDEIECILHLDARPATLRRKTPRVRVRGSAEKLREWNARKVVVDPLGNLLPARD